MKRSELLERANRWTESRYGVKVSDRSLSDWVAEGLIPGPERVPNPGQTGSQRIWSAKSYHRVLQICRMKSFAPATFDQIRIYLWLRSADPMTPELREIMVKEGRRIFRDMRRPYRTTSEPRSDRTIHNEARIGRNRQKKVDKRLQPIWAGIAPQDSNKLFDAALFLSNHGDAAAAALAVIENFLPTGPNRDVEGNSSDLKNILPTFVSAFSGLLDIPEDNDSPVAGSGLYSIENASLDLINLSRDIAKMKQGFFMKMPTLLSTINRRSISTEPFSAIANSLQYYPWNFLIFIFVVHSQMNTRPVSKGLISFIVNIDDKCLQNISDMLAINGEIHA